MTQARPDRRLAIGAAFAGLLAAALTYAALRAGYGQLIFAAAGVALVATSVGYLLWRANPAVTLTGAFVLSSVSGHWAQAGSPLGGNVAPDRLLLLGALGVVVLRGPWMRNRPPIRFAAVHYLLFAAVLYASVSAFVSGSLTVQAPFFRLAESFGVGPFLVFLLAPYIFVQRRQREILLVGLVAFGTYLGVTAVFELAHFRALIFPRYINDASVGIHFGRARGPFTEAVTNGTALYACAVASAIAARTWERRGARWYAASIGALCLVGTFLTFQRSVWLAAVAATLITGAVTRPLRRFLAPAVLIATAVLMILLAASPGLRDKATQRKNDIGTVNDRQNLNRAALNMVEARPLFGFGWEQFTNRGVDYFQQSFNFPLSANGIEVHNLYLGYAAGLGLVGTLIWVLGVLAGIGGALRTRGPPDLEPWRVGLLAVAIFFLIVSAFVPPQVFPNLLLWLWAGVVWSPRILRGRRTTVATRAVAATPSGLAGGPVVADPFPVVEPEPSDAPTIEFAPLRVRPGYVVPRGEAAAALALATSITSAARGAAWRGPDPYDGLWGRSGSLVASRRRGRQAIIQLGVRSPINLRPFFRSEDPLIAKAPALFGAAATRAWELNGAPALEELAREALGTVARLQDGPAWGYPFPVQTRWSFYDADTPNVVVTSFCALALAEGARAFDVPEWEERARRAADWVLSELWFEPGGFFAYHPYSRELVHNANLLGARLACRLLPDDPRTRPAVSRALDVTIGAQRDDGSFPYGAGAQLGWADSFHTGYVLECLSELQGVHEGATDAMTLGAAYWTSRFFGPRGEARLWPDQEWPVDGHSAGTALSTIAALAAAGIDDLALGRRVAVDVRTHGMRNGHGIHRRGRGSQSRVVYPRWVDGHLALGLASFAAQVARRDADA